MLEKMKQAFVRVRQVITAKKFLTEWVFLGGGLENIEQIVKQNRRTKFFHS